MSERDSCEVCCGEGYYPIHNKHGREMYSIRCPECYGSGYADESPSAG